MIKLSEVFGKLRWHYLSRYNRRASTQLDRRGRSNSGFAENRCLNCRFDLSQRIHYQPSESRSLCKHGEWYILQCPGDVRPRVFRQERFRNEHRSATRRLWNSVDSRCGNGPFHRILAEEGSTIRAVTLRHRFLCYRHLFDPLAKFTKRLQLLDKQALEFLTLCGQYLVASGSLEQFRARPF